MERSQREAAAALRIEPTPGLPPQEISGRVLNEMCTHALETRPEECCGLVSGSPDTPRSRYLNVHRCRNEMTAHHRADPVTFPRTGREAYYMSEIDYLRAQREAEARGEVVTAVYHSHVGAGLYLSEMDQEFVHQPLFPFPDAAQIVLAVAGRRVAGAAVFERSPDGLTFLGRRLSAGDF